MQSEVEQFSLSFFPILNYNYPDYKDFTCGNTSMNRFLKEEAYFRHINKDASTTLVYIEGELVAYFTLTHKEIPFETGEDNNIESVNCLEIARIGVSVLRQRKGIGQAIVNHIIESAYMLNERYIVALALSEKLDWYREHFRFIIAYEDELTKDTGEPVTFIYLNLEFPELREEYEINP